MKSITQKEDQSHILHAIEQTHFNELREERLEEKKKKIPDDLGMALTAIISQLSPDTNQLIAKFIELDRPSVTADSALAGRRYPDDTGNSVRVGDAIKSDKNQTGIELDAMLLSAAAAVAGQRLPVVERSASPSVEDGADSSIRDDDKSASRKAAERGKSAESDELTEPGNNVQNIERSVIDNNPDAAGSANVDQQHANVAARDLRQPANDTTSTAKSAAKPAFQVDAATKTSGVASRMEQNRMQAAQESNDMAAPSVKPKAVTDQHGEMAQPESESLRHKEQRDELSELDSALSMPAQLQPQPLQEVPAAQLQQQAPHQSAAKRAAELARIRFATQNQKGSAEGIRYSLESWGGNQSVQIVGSNQAGYTLRPSDSSVKQILEQHKVDDLTISIADAPPANDREAQQ